MTIEDKGSPSGAREDQLIARADRCRAAIGFGREKREEAELDGRPLIKGGAL